MPIVPAAVIYDLVEGDPSARPDAAAGYAACEVAVEGFPSAVASAPGPARRSARSSGASEGGRPGSATRQRAQGAARPWRRSPWSNAFGDVIAEDGTVLAGPRGDDGESVSTAETLTTMTKAPDWSRVEELNTTLVCVMTDAPLDKPACTRVARMASGGVARAVDPVFSSVDGDVAFCLASGGSTGRRIASSRSRRERSPPP